MDLKSKEWTLDDIIKQQEEESKLSCADVVTKTQKIVKENLLNIIDPAEYELLLKSWFLEEDLQLFYDSMRWTLFNEIRNTDKHLRFYNWATIPSWGMNKNNFLYLLEGLVDCEVDINDFINHCNVSLEKIKSLAVKENPKFSSSNWTFDSFFSEEEKQASIDKEEKIINITKYIRDHILLRYK